MELPQAKPKEEKTKRGYNVHECPNCHAKLEIIPRKVVEVETDEFGKLLRDKDGKLIPKITQSYRYQTFTEVYAITDTEVELFNPLRERNQKEREEIEQLTLELSTPKPRSKAEREFAEKNRKPKILAEVLA